jgi:hypothetical protein
MLNLGFEPRWVSSTTRNLTSWVRMIPKEVAVNATPIVAMYSPRKEKNIIYQNILGEDDTEDHTKIFCCKVVSFPSIWVPLHHEKLKREDIQPVG